MNKLVILLLTFILGITLCACNKDPDITIGNDQITTNTITTGEYLGPNAIIYLEPEIYTLSDTQILEERNCKLIVNGKDITYNNYVKLIPEYQTAEIPLIAVLNELGIDVAWESNKSLIILYPDGKKSLDLSHYHLGVLPPPGTLYTVRKVVNKELIYDATSIRSLFNTFQKVTIELDFDSMTIYIDKQVD